MSKHNSLIIWLAKELSPKDSKSWVNDMASEYSFVEKNKFAWEIGIFNFALRQRMTSIKLSSPQSLAFASFTATAILALLIVLPNKSLLFHNQNNNSNTISVSSDISPEGESTATMAQAPTRTEVSAEINSRVVGNGSTSAAIVDKALIPEDTAREESSTEEAILDASAAEPQAEKTTNEAPARPIVEAMPPGGSSGAVGAVGSARATGTVVGGQDQELESTASFGAVASPKETEMNTNTALTSDNAIAPAATVSEPIATTPQAETANIAQDDGNSTSLLKLLKPDFESKENRSNSYADKSELATIEVNTKNLELQIISETHIKIYSGIEISEANIILDKIAKADETFELNIPFIVKTDNNKAILVANQNLGEITTAKTILFILKVMP